MHLQLTRKQIVNTLLMATLALGIGSFNSPPAAAQMDRSAFREMAAELDLSRSQMRKVAGIMRGMKSDIKEILTPQQFELLQATGKQQSQDQNPQELRAELNLTDTQSTQISEVQEETVVELQSVLTPEQLEGIMEMTAFGNL